MFSDWQIIFHMGFFLGFFPVKYHQATQEFTFQPACGLVFGVFWAAVFCLFLYLHERDLTAAVIQVGLALDSHVRNDPLSCDSNILYWNNKLRCHFQL